MLQLERRKRGRVSLFQISQSPRNSSPSYLVSVWKLARLRLCVYSSCAAAQTFISANLVFSPHSSHSFLVIHRCAWCCRAVHNDCKRELPEHCDRGAHGRSIIPPNCVTLRKGGSRNQKEVSTVLSSWVSGARGEEEFLEDLVDYPLEVDWNWSAKREECHLLSLHSLSLSLWFLLLDNRKRETWFIFRWSSKRSPFLLTSLISLPFSSCVIQRVVLEPEIMLWRCSRLYSILVRYNKSIIVSWLWYLPSISANWP